jgi:hypothetical protein
MSKMQSIIQRTLWAAVLGLTVSASSAAWRFPLEAELVSERVADRAERHRIYLGRLKKIGNTLAPEDQIEVNGERSSQLYRADGGYDIDDVTQALAAELSLGFEQIYQCQGRRCGSSNEWANAVFQEPKLYGPEETQFYWVGRAPHGEYGLIYASQRSNKPVYVQWDQITATDGAFFTESILDRLGTEGVVRLELEAAEQQLEVLASVVERFCVLNQNNDLGLAVTAEALGSDAGWAQSTDKATQLQGQINALVQSRAQGSQFECLRQSAGLGALAPLADAPVKRLDLVVLPRQKPSS